MKSMSRRKGFRDFFRILPAFEDIFQHLYDRQYDLFWVGVSSFSTDQISLFPPERGCAVCTLRKEYGRIEGADGDSSRPGSPPIGCDAGIHHFVVVDYLNVSRSGFGLLSMLYLIRFI